MKQKKDQKQIMREYYLRQTRQIIAVAIVSFLVLLAAVLYKRPLFGEIPKNMLFGVQIGAIALFAAFTFWNWKCPSCNKGLGGDILREHCKHCGTRLR
jgi:uncharacterized membrane protein